MAFLTPEMAFLTPKWHFWPQLALEIAWDAYFLYGYAYFLYGYAYGPIGIQSGGVWNRGIAFEFWSRGSSSFSGPVFIQFGWPFDLEPRLRVLVPRVKSCFCDCEALVQRSGSVSLIGWRKFLWGLRPGQRASLGGSLNFELPYR